MTIFWNEAILQFDENSGQTPAVFVCAGEVSGFSVGGSVAPSETGAFVRAGGYRHVDLVVLVVGVGGGRGNMRVRVCPQDVFVVSAAGARSVDAACGAGLS